MGILKEKVSKAFDKFERGNIKGFALALADVSNAIYRWQHTYVLDYIEEEVEERGLTQGETPTQILDILIEKEPQPFETIVKS
ncbi:MAG: hypothetical protein ACOC1X_02055 [Promethearchaeota archaeon]